MINDVYDVHLVDLVARHYPGLPGLGLALAVVRVSAGEEACIMHGVITYIRYHTDQCRILYRLPAIFSIQMIGCSVSNVKIIFDEREYGGWTQSN